MDCHVDSWKALYEVSQKKPRRKINHAEIKLRRKLKYESVPRFTSAEILKLADSAAESLWRCHNQLAIFEEMQDKFEKDSVRSGRTKENLQKRANDIASTSDAYVITTDMSLKNNILSYGMLFAGKKNHIRGIQLDHRIVDQVKVGDLELFGDLVALKLLTLDPTLEYTNQELLIESDAMIGIERMDNRRRWRPIHWCMVATLSSLPNGGAMEYVSGTEKLALCHDIAGVLSGSVAKYDIEKKKYYAVRVEVQHDQMNKLTNLTKSMTEVDAENNFDEEERFAKENTEDSN
ncbi:hypothetical protein L596_029008 [Steinernema carpocapsae]|uniref:Uncharacterized protein n=1 Tax=Steinernema carpocapsae TaxID=34508 RepID=A0A4U5LTC8_STECR|nr:hypothetical protein L596_029008 [Steinernema carpocapsae]